MTEPANGLRAFKPAFILLGAAYVLMAGSALFQGPAFLEDFGVSHELTVEPVLADFFHCFYELMAFIGVLMVVFGLVTHGHRAQVCVASTFFVASMLIAARDLSTSDTRFGSALYKGEATMIFVAISVVYAAVFGGLALAGLRRTTTPPT